jgi:hypothetical protein
MYGHHQRGEQFEGITTLNAAELARTSSESLRAISESPSAQKSGVPISEDVIFAINPGTFADSETVSPLTSPR